MADRSNDPQGLNAKQEKKKHDSYLQAEEYFRNQALIREEARKKQQAEEDARKKALEKEIAKKEAKAYENYNNRKTNADLASGAITPEQAQQKREQTKTESENIANKTAETDKTAENSTETDKTVENDKPITPEQRVQKAINSGLPAGAIAGLMFGKAYENSEHPAASGLRRQAELHRREAAELGKMEQKQWQEANKNYRTMAGEDAATDASSTNEQTIRNDATANGQTNGANTHLLRGTGKVDLQAKQNYATDQRDKAQKTNADKNTVLQYAEQEETSGDIADRQIADMNASNAESANYSNPPGTAKPPVVEEPDVEKPDVVEEPVVEKEPELESYNTDYQSVLNYLTYGNDPTSMWNLQVTSAEDSRVTPEHEQNRKNAADFAQAKGWKPITTETDPNVAKYWKDTETKIQQTDPKRYNNAKAGLQTIVTNGIPGFKDFWQNEDSGRFKKDANGNLVQINAGDNDATVEKFHSYKTGDEQRPVATTENGANLADSVRQKY